MVGSASESAPRAAPRRIAWPLWFAIIGGGAVAVLLAAVVVATVVERRMYANRVLPGVEVDGVSSGGHHEVTVYDSVARLGVRLAQAPIQVKIGDREFSAGPSLLALSIDARATADAAMDQGRHGNPFSQAFGTVLRFFRPDRVRLRAVYDENRLEGLLDGWAAETDTGRVEGDLRFDGTRVVRGRAPHRDRPRARPGTRRAHARTARQRAAPGPHAAGRHPGAGGRRGRGQGRRRPRPAASSRTTSRS